MEFKTLVTPSSPRECRLQHWKLLGGERDKYRVTSHPEFYPKLNGVEKPWIQNNPINTSLSLLLSPIALHPSGKGAGAIFNSVLLLCHSFLCCFSSLITPPSKVASPHPTQTYTSAHSALALLLYLYLTSLE